MVEASRVRGHPLLTLARLIAGAPQPELLARAVSAWSALRGFASLRDAGVLTNIPGLPSMTKLEDTLVASVVAMS